MGLNNEPFPVMYYFTQCSTEKQKTWNEHTYVFRLESKDASLIAGNCIIR